MPVLRTRADRACRKSIRRRLLAGSQAGTAPGYRRRNRDRRRTCTQHPDGAPRSLPPHRTAKCRRRIHRRSRGHIRPRRRGQSRGAVARTHRPASSPPTRGRQTTSALSLAARRPHARRCGSDGDRVFCFRRRPAVAAAGGEQEHDAQAMTNASEAGGDSGRRALPSGGGGRVRGSARVRSECGDRATGGESTSRQASTAVIA
jgi:hypothetical protein